MKICLTCGAENFRDDATKCIKCQGKELRISVEPLKKLIPHSNKVCEIFCCPMMCNCGDCSRCYDNKFARSMKRKVW